MKLAAAYVLHLLPAASSLAAAVSLTAVYGTLSTVAYAYFGIWAYSPYLYSALGAGGKFTGFLLRSVFLANHDVNVGAASSVFIQAGMSACTSAVALALGEWFKHSDAASAQLSLQRRHPRLLPLACRLMGLPVVLFGPGIGIAAAILMYGVRTADSMRTAQTIRKYSAWGTLACLVVISLIALLALTLAVLHRRRQAGDSVKPVLLVSTALASVLLIMVSGAARVRALGQPTVSTNDQLYYPLIVLPELLQQLLYTVPTLLHRIGFAEQYTGWRTAARSWVRRSFPGDAAQAPAGVHVHVSLSTASSAHSSVKGTLPSGKPSTASIAASASRGSMAAATAPPPAV